MLSALISEVGTQRGITISGEDADSLYAALQDIINLLENNIGSLQAIIT
jgi:hypothetical protein